MRGAAGTADAGRRRADRRRRCRSSRPRWSGRSARPRRTPGIARSCCPTAPSRVSSAASAPSPRCAAARSTRSTRARPCCCASCPRATRRSPSRPARVTVVNPCLSGGALEIFLEPRLPAPLLAVVGTTPIADAVATRRTARLRDRVARPADDHRQARPRSSSPATGGDEAARSAPRWTPGVGFVGLVASRRRGAAVLDELGLTDDERARVHTPVGLDIGARTAEEIALSIMAEVVRAIRRGGPRPAAGRRRAGDRRGASIRSAACRSWSARTPRTSHGRRRGPLVLQPRLPRAGTSAS